MSDDKDYAMPRLKLAHSDLAAADITREKLLSAGIMTFAELGYHAASTRLIESAAGVNRNLISYHWGSKEAFWMACFDCLAQNINREMRLAEEQAMNVGGIERLRFFIRAYVRATAKFPELQSIMMDEGRRAESRLEWIVKRYAKPFYERVSAILDEAREMGAVIDMDAHNFYYALVGSSSMFSMAPECHLLSGKDPRDDAVVARHADVIAQHLVPDPSLKPESTKGVDK